MTRRAALAIALCLTTIVAFFIVAYGSRSGLFGGDHGADRAAAQVDPTAEPTQPPALAAPSQPEVIEQYVYRDVYVPSPDSGTASGTTAPRPPQESAPVTQTKPPGPAATAAPQPTSPPAPKGVEFSGEITAISGSIFTVDSGSGQLTVKLAPNTSVHGELEVGATVHVHGFQSADGSVVASEVEVAGGGDD